MSRLICFLFLFSLTCGLTAGTDDWPMWRYDAGRTACSPAQLPESLHLEWKVTYTPRIPVWDDPLNRNLMQFDRIFEPIVADNKVFLGFNDQDKVVALDLETGKELWHYYADGPVRLPLVYDKKRVYFTGDDGWCYCLNSDDGKLIWKKLLAPSENKLLGNKRLISMWPARGGLVIRDGILYTAASIFPMMGTFIYALDAATGDVIWKNEETGSNYILQPHKSPAFADVAPQGPFTISGDRLLVAGGRSVPAAFDLKTGEELYYQLAASGKTGGSFTCANDKVFFNHHRERLTTMYDAQNGNKITVADEYPVIQGNTVWFSGKMITESLVDSKNQLQEIRKMETAATNDLIMAGNTLYAADSSGISAVKILPGSAPEITWTWQSDEIIERLVAANGKLIAVTDRGSILAFGDSPQAIELSPVINKTREISENGIAEKINKVTEINEGYGLVLGSRDPAFYTSLVSETSLNLIAYEKDPEKVEKLRSHFDNAGITAERMSFLPAVVEFPVLPEYFASLMVINDLACTGNGDPDILRRIYRSVRPYGGVILFDLSRRDKKLIRKKVLEADLSGSVLEEKEGYLLVKRPGPLKGASPWTHNYGDMANTVKSDDQLVKAPLGILWFGGNSNMDVLPRHGHGPGEQVIDGRLIIQGINSLSARDVYTGRVLWKKEFEKLSNDSWMVYYDETYDEENPLDPKYNQVHLPGANSRGTNFIATREYVYLIEENRCHVIDIRTGKTEKVFETGSDSTLHLGYIGVYEDLLILGNNFAEFSGMENDSIRIKSPKFTDYNLTASRELMVMNRFSGEKLWSIKANHGFIHNAVIAGEGKLFCLDKLPQYLETKLKRRGEPLPAGSRLLALDARTGRVIRELTDDIFGTWLGYSEDHRLLLQATRPSRDMLNGEEGNRMIVYRLPTGEKLWDKSIKYANPPIIHKDKIYTNGEGFHLLTGEPLMETDPVTGEELKWQFKREYGCGIVAASEYLLTFRSASAGFVNLESFEGTGSLGGWKPGCSTNLIAADGVLNSPDYTRTCQCPYQNQTSLALVHMPWMSYWTNSNYTWNGKPIQQLGLNFNAPGDRSSNDQTLWFEYPPVAGIPPGIPVDIDSLEHKAVRKEPYTVISENTPWVSSSALCGIQTLKVTLAEDPEVPETAYTVKLYFAELENKNPGERIFDVILQGKKVFANLDVVEEAGKSDKEIIKTFTGVKAGKTLQIDLVPVKGQTLICGLELVKESVTENK